MQSELTRIQSGWTAFDNTDDKIGEIVETGPNYFVVQKGLFLPSDIYVPLTAVSSASPAEQRVTLNVAKGDIDSLGWKEPPTPTSHDTRAESNDVLTGNRR
jgi:hypothetical protein